MTNWQTKKLGELLTIRHGRNQREVESADGEYPILGTGGEMGRATKYLYDKPSVLIGRKGTIDKPRYMDTPFWTVDTLFYSEIKSENVPKFLYYVFNTIDWKRYNEASGVPSLSASTISTIKVNIPEKREQQRIVGVLEVWDEYIEKLEQKIALKEQLKKGLMQQLLTGKRRLPGFSEEWRTYKLGDFLQEPIYKRETNPKDIELLTVRLHTKGVQASGKFPFATEKGRPYYRRYQGEILVGRQNFHNGGVGEVTEETNGLIASNAISSYLPKVNADLDFILFALQRGDFYKRIGHIIGGTGQKEISPSEFKKLKITMPELEEQKAIASVIKKSNEDLHTLYEYAKYINQQKKYLLRNLITGTIRTPEDLKPLDRSRLERSAL